jgi:hypothetical protein
LPHQKKANLQQRPVRTVKNVAVHVSVIAKRVASANPDAVNQIVHHLMESVPVALMEKPLTSSLHTGSPLVALMEDPLVSDLLRADLLMADPLQTETLDTKRLSASLIKTRTVSWMKKNEQQQGSSFRKDLDLKDSLFLTATIRGYHA